MITRILDSDEPQVCIRCGGVIAAGEPQVIYSDGENGYICYHRQCDIDDSLERETAVKRYELFSDREDELM